MRAPIRVLVVDDSALTRQLLTRALSVDPAIEIVATAKDGVECVELAAALDPDVITLDIEMPGLTGIEALPHLARHSSARVVMLSGVDDPETTYQALSLGAIDFVVKPKAGIAMSMAALSETMIKAIKTAYRVPPDRRPVGRPAHAEVTGASGTPTEPAGPSAPTANRLVLIAASTGGPPALETVLRGLEPDLPATYAIVQHLPPGFTESLARRLDRAGGVKVVQATEGVRMQRGVAYLAPHGVHMRVDGRRSFRLAFADGPPLHGVRPAADPLFESAAGRAGTGAVGVLLTGMGTDGALGLKAIRDAGGRTIAQDEATSIVWGMPGAAVRLDAAERVVPIDRIAAMVRDAVTVVSGA